MNMYWFLSLFFVGCGDVDRGSLEQASILAIGDSIFEWHIWNQKSVPEHLDSDLGTVYNAALSGAMITEEISSGVLNQYKEGDWDWVVMDGGGNDLNDLCLCDDCSEVQDQIELAYQDFLQDRIDDGQQVLIWGYYGLPKNAKFGFDECVDDFEELSRRQKKLSEMDDRIVFVDGKEKITGEDKSYFYFDRVHPSKKGTSTIGEQISKAMRDHSD